MAARILLVGLGPHAHAKYLPLLTDAKHQGLVDRVQVLDLDSQQAAVHAALSRFPGLVSNLHFIPDRRDRGAWHTPDATTLIAGLAASGEVGKMLISTEPKAHAGYLRDGLENGLDCFVDKPVVVPMRGDHVMDSEAIAAATADIARLAEKTGRQCVVNAPRRYHWLYRFVFRYLGFLTRAYRMPVTSVSIRHAGGVWNMKHEYYKTQDHPYRFGYGMLAHSGYHFVDLLALVLAFNCKLFGTLRGQLSLFKRTVPEQIGILPSGVYERFSGPLPPAAASEAVAGWGETDIVSSFRIAAPSQEAVCLGGLEMQQTTTSTRHWNELPAAYNRNGRYPVEDLKIHIGHLASIDVRLFKYGRRGDALRRGCDISVWRNGALLDGASFWRKSFVGDGRLTAELGPAQRKLFREWLLGRPTRSEISQHINTAHLFQAFAQALAADNGRAEFILRSA